MKLGFIGAGNMAQAMIGGVLGSGLLQKDDIIASAATQNTIEKVQKLKKYVRSLRLAFTVNNLATISGYSGLSPMINSSTVNSTLGLDDKRGYPLARTYTLGLSINF